MINLLKRLFCRHKRAIITPAYRDDITGIYMYERWECRKCGKWKTIKD